jgi:hypothetical protein
MRCSQAGPPCEKDEVPLMPKGLNGDALPMVKCVANLLALTGQILSD